MCIYKCMLRSPVAATLIQGCHCRRESWLLSRVGDRRLYFVHSFRATPSRENESWVLATTSYGSDFISVMQQGKISATQFHPEKSGSAGLDVLKSFLQADRGHAYVSPGSNGEVS